MTLVDRILGVLPMGPRTSRELGEALGVRTRSVRWICRALAREGTLVQDIAVRHTGQVGRPARPWRLAREQLALPLRVRTPEASLPELVEAIPKAAPRDRAALLLLIDRARTPDELKAQLSLRTLREAFDLVAGLERRGLVQPVPGRRAGRRAEQLYELHPLFLVRIGQEPHHWRPDELQP